MLSERVDALAAWIKELDAQLHASAAVGDSKTLKELAKALAAWNKHDPKLEERVTNRVDVLADRFATLAGTVNVTATSLAGKDGEIANLRRELEEGNARIESVVRELRQAGSGPEVAELRRAVAELSSERRLRPGEQRVDEISAEVDVIAQRFDTLSKTVSTTAAGLAGREGELVAMRTRLDETDARASSLVGELRASVEALSRQVAGLDARSDDPKSILLFESRLDDLSGNVEQIAESLDAVAASVASASADIAANETELATTNQRFEETSAQVDAMILELQTTVAALPATGVIDAEVEERLHALGRRADEATGHLAQLQAALAAQLDESSSSATTVDLVLSEVAERLTELERGRDAAITELDRSTLAWVEERAWVRRQLEQLAIAVGEASADESLELRLQELASRIEEMEQRPPDGGHRGRACHRCLGRRESRAEGRARRACGDARLVVGAGAHADAGGRRRRIRGAPYGAHAPPRVDRARRRRCGRGDRPGRSVLGSGDRLARVPPRRHRGVHAGSSTDTRYGNRRPRVDELARRLEAIEQDRVTTQDSPAEAQELRDLRVLMNGLRMRLTSSEKEIAALELRRHRQPARRHRAPSRLARALELDVRRRTGPCSRRRPLSRRAARHGAKDGAARSGGSREPRGGAHAVRAPCVAASSGGCQQLELESADAGYSTKATPGRSVRSSRSGARRRSDRTGGRRGCGIIGYSCGDSARAAAARLPIGCSRARSSRRIVRSHRSAKAGTR